VGFESGGEGGTGRVVGGSLYNNLPSKEYCVYMCECLDTCGSTCVRLGGVLYGMTRLYV